MEPRQRFEAIFVTHYRDVLRYALRRTDPAHAEEVAAEAFLVAWRRLERVPEDPLPWLYAAAGHVLSNQRRAAGRSARRERAAAEPARAGRDPAERFAERDAALRAFTTLGERDREALRLVAWERLSLADAARAAGTSRAAFAMRVHRARRRLAAALHDEDAAIAPELPEHAAPATRELAPATRERAAPARAHHFDPEHGNA